MIIDITKLPKKINEIAYFKKNENGSIIYNYSKKSKDSVVMIELEDTEIEKDFAIAGTTLEMVRKLKPVDSVELDGNKFVIKSKKGTFKGSLLDETLVMLNTTITGTIKVNLKALKILSEFVSDNDKKPILTGVNIFNDGTMVATDSFKLARYLGNTTIAVESNITIPKAFVDLIKNEITTDEVELSYNNSTVLLKVDNITYVSNLLAGAYPDVRRIFTTSDKEIIFDTESLKENIDLAKNVGISEGGEKFLPLTFDNGNLIADGISLYETNLLTLTNEEYNFTLSIDAIDLVLRHIENKEVYFGFIADNKPIQIKDNGIEYVILPIKVNK